jgi:hypothetical protein
MVKCRRTAKVTPRKTNASVVWFVHHIRRRAQTVIVKSEYGRLEAHDQKPPATQYVSDLRVNHINLGCVTLTARLVP